MRFDRILRARSLHHRLTSRYQPLSSLLRALLERNATDQPLVCNALTRLVYAGDRDKSGRYDLSDNRLMKEARG